MDGRPQQVVGRIDEAVKTMTELTETFLWLSQNETGDIPLEQVNLTRLVQDIADDLNYLIRGRDIALNIQTQEIAVDLALTPARVVIMNLIKNLTGLYGWKLQIHPADKVFTIKIDFPLPPEYEKRSSALFINAQNILNDH